MEPQRLKLRAEAVKLRAECEMLRIEYEIARDGVLEQLKAERAVAIGLVTAGSLASVTITDAQPRPLRVPRPDRPLKDGEPVVIVAPVPEGAAPSAPPRPKPEELAAAAQAEAAQAKAEKEAREANKKSFAELEKDLQEMFAENRADLTRRYSKWAEKNLDLEVAERAYRELTR
jgi:hypothetical protein